jgi:hypothetical protein
MDKLTIITTAALVVIAIAEVLECVIYLLR